MPHPEDLVEQINADLCYIQRTASRAEEQQDTTTLAEIQAVLALAMAQLSSRVFLASSFSHNDTHKEQRYE
jgi:hypothetical protein